MEGDGDILNQVRNMIHQNIIKNNNRGFGKLEINDEVAFKDHLKKQLAEIQDRQQAEEMRLETDQ